MDTASRFTLLADQRRMALWAEARGASIDESSPVWSDAEEINGWCRQKGIPSFELVVDAPGVGSGVVDDCRRRGRNVTEYWGWSPCAGGEDDRRFSNQRASVFWHLRKLLESGRGEPPRDLLLREEALAIEYSLDAKGRIQIVAKEDLRKALGRSPDRLDATVIALAAALGGIRQPTVRFSTVSA